MKFVNSYRFQLYVFTFMLLRAKVFLLKTQKPSKENNKDHGRISFVACFKKKKKRQPVNVSYPAKAKLKNNGYSEPARFPNLEIIFFVKIILQILATRGMFIFDY